MRTLTAAMALLAAPAAALAQEPGPAAPDYDAVARTIVTQSAEIQPGEVVLVRGLIEALPLFEAIVAATTIAGGRPIPVLDLPGAEIKAMQEAPLDYLRQEHTDEFALLEALDVFIEVSAAPDPANIGPDIPMERRIAARDGRASYLDAVYRSPHREVLVGQSIGQPTRAYAEFAGVDFAEMDRVFWRAMAVTPEQIGAVGQKIGAMMTPGAEMRLTGPGGTDLTFTLSGDPARINTGRASENAPETGPAQAFLPAGEFAACVDPSSAAGVVVIPSFRAGGEDVQGLSLTFENGVVTGMSADSGGDTLRAFLDAQEAPTRSLSLVNIGLNPESRMIPGWSYRSWEMGGFVTLLMGDNTIYDCGHAAEGRWHPHIEGLTLTANGAPVVANGALAVE